MNKQLTDQLAFLPKQQIPNIQINRFNSFICDDKSPLYKSMSSLQKSRLSQSRVFVQIVGQITGQNAYKGSKYEFELYIYEPKGSKVPPIILIKDINFVHILVKLGRGRVYIPQLQKCQEHKETKGWIIDIIKQFQKRFNQILPTNFQQIKHQNIYPSNLDLWKVFCRGKGLSVEFLKQISPKPLPIKKK